MTISFQDFLVEAKQVGTLYHFTTSAHFRKILETGKIRSGYNGRISTSRNYSLSRNPNIHSHPEINQENGYTVRIALDGDKISERHKIKPVRGLPPDDKDVFNPSLNKQRVPKEHGEQEETIGTKHLPFHKDHVQRVDFIHHHVGSDPDHPMSMNSGVFDKEFSPKLKQHGIPHSIGRKWNAGHKELKEGFCKYDGRYFGPFDYYMEVLIIL